MIKFPLSRQPTFGASRMQIVRSRLREWFGTRLNSAGAPGVICPMDFNDPVTGDHIVVELTPLRTVLSVNGRDYTFSRLTGEFVGTGMSSCRSRGRRLTTDPRHARLT